MDGIVDPRTAIQAAKLVSFPSAFFLAGYGYSYSHNTIPSLYDLRPQISTPVFTRLWSGRSPLFTSLTVLSTSASAYLAYVLPEHRRSWTTAAAAMFLTMPWTGLVMLPGIRRIFTIDQNKQVQLKSEQTLEHRQKMIRFVKQNYVTVALYIVSALAGLRAAFRA